VVFPLSRAADTELLSGREGTTEIVDLTRALTGKPALHHLTDFCETIALVWRGEGRIVWWSRSLSGQGRWSSQNKSGPFRGPFARARRCADVNSCVFPPGYLPFEPPPWSEDLVRGRRRLAGHRHRHHRVRHSRRCIRAPFRITTTLIVSLTMKWRRTNYSRDVSTSPEN